MSLNPDVPTGEIVEQVRRIYGLDTLHVALIAGRAHAEAAVYRLDDHERSYFLKLTPEHRGAPLHSLDISLTRVSRRYALRYARAMDNSPRGSETYRRVSTRSSRVRTGFRRR